MQGVRTLTLGHISCTISGCFLKGAPSRRPALPLRVVGQFDIHDLTRDSDSEHQRERRLFLPTYV